MARPQPSLRFADGGSFITRWAEGVMRPNATAKRLREIEAPPPPPPAQPPAPPPPPPNPRVTKDNPAGIRFQDGGYVPGTGRGDKIPAKYEPGEFVVSNDMIDDNPGLREQLAGLRAETLAARGKTVAEADAKALRRDSGGADLPRGGRPQVSLRASDGFFDDLHRGQAAPAARATAQQAANTARNTALPPTPNTIVQGPNGAALPGQQYPGRELAVQGSRGVAPLPPPPAAPNTALVRTADVGNNGYKPNFTMGGDGPPARPMPEGLRPGEAGELSQNARAQAAARAQARATSGLLDEASAATRAASEATPPTPARTLRSVAGTAASVVGSGLLYGGAAAGGVAAARALRDAGAPKANPSVMAGERQPGDSGLSHLIPTGGTGPAPAAQPYNFWSDNEVGRNIGNTANAIAPLGGVAMAARVPGALTRTAGLADAAITGLAGGVQAVRGDGRGQTLRNPQGGPAGPAEPAGVQTPAPAERPAAPGGYDPNQSRPDLGYGPIGDRTKLTNEQAAIMNPAGRVTMTRGANGNMEFSGGNVSGQVSYNDAGGKAYAGGGLPLPGGGSQGFANFDVAPAGADVAMGPGGYAFATSGSGLRGQGAGGQGSAPQTLGGVDVSGLSGEQAVKYAAEVRNAQRINASQSALREAASSYGSSSGRSDLRSPEYLAARARKMDTALDYNRMSRSEIQARTALTQIEAQQQTAQMQQQTAQRGQDMTAETSRYGADASRYGSDSSLRGQMYAADARRGSERAETQQKLRQQQIMGSIYQAAGGDAAEAAKLAASYGIDPKQFTDMAGAQQTRAKANSEDAQSTFKGLFTDREGKRDEHAEARAHQLASQVVPGWENMNPEQRNANRAKVVDATRTVQGMNSLRNNGWGQAIGWDAPTPEYSQLPDLNGATVGHVGLWEGATTPKVGKNDTKVTLRNGEQRYLPAGTLSEAQLRMMQDNGAMRSTR